MNVPLNQFVEYYIYYRVSTRAQDSDQTHGLDIQTTQCENYAEKNFGIKEQQINYYCDIGSSYNLKSRLPQLGLLIKNLVPNSVILIWDVSRLGRDAIGVFSVLKKIREKRCVIISVRDYLTFGLRANEDKLFYHKIIGSEAESDAKSLRSKAIFKKYRAAQIHIGTIPFGFKLDKKRKLTESKKEQDVISTLRAKYQELKSYTGVANFYNKTKMLYRGKCWTGRRVQYLLKRTELDSMSIEDSLTNQIDNCNLNCV